MKMGFNQTVDSLLNLTGIAPLRGSRAALPIACDALNARTVAVREYHYVFCASSPTGCYACFPASVLVARLSRAGKSRRDNVMAHPPHGSAQKERIRFALCCAAVILRRFLCQGSKDRNTQSGKGWNTSRFYLSVLKDRTARMSFACSRSRKSSSTP